MTPEQQLAIVREANTAFGLDFRYCEAFALSYHRMKTRTAVHAHKQERVKSESFQAFLAKEQAEKELHGESSPWSPSTGPVRSA